MLFKIMTKIRKKAFLLLFVSFFIVVGITALGNDSQQTNNINENINLSDSQVIKNEIYNGAKKTGFTGTYEEWEDAINCEGHNHDIEIRVSENGFLQWKFIDESDSSWRNLILLSDLAGIIGQNPYIGINGNWWIGNEDTGARASGKSAYEIYCENYPDYIGTEQEWLDDLINGRLGNRKQYKVSFDSQGGNAIPTQDVEFGGKVQKPVNPIKDGSHFLGWYVEDELWSFIGYSVTEDITLTAKWLFEYTLGLTFAINADNASYAVTGYHGSDLEVVIPSMYQGLEVTVISNSAFKDTLITNVVIPETVTVIEPHAFNNCIKLTDVTIPSKVSRINGYTFYNCIRLTNIIIPENVTVISAYSFYNCRLLKNASIGENVLTIGDYAFYSCVSLTEIIIPDSVTYVGKMSFNDCTRLANIRIGRNVKTIAEKAFAYCPGLSEIILPMSITSLGVDVFRDCTNLQTIYVIGYLSRPSGWSAFPSKVKVVWDYHESPGLVFTLDVSQTSYRVTDCLGTGVFNEIEIPSEYQGLPVTEIGDNAFKNKLIFSVIIPDSVITIGNYAFYNCTKLTEVSIGNSVVSIGKYAFSCCYYLTEIRIPNSTKYIEERVFASCFRLLNVTLSDNLIKIGDYAFSFCRVLAEIQIPDTVETIGVLAFESCQELEYIKIGNAVTTIGSSAFSKCTSLVSIIISNSVTKIGTDAFKSCTSLSTIYVIGYTSKPKGWADLPSNVRIFWNYQL